MSTLEWIAKVLVLVGALNWGLIGVANLDLVKSIFGGQTQYEPTQGSRLVYTLVGLAAIYLLLFGNITG